MTVRIPIVSGTVVNELFPSVLSCATFIIVFKKQTNKLGCFFFVIVFKPRALPEAPNNTSQPAEVDAFPSSPPGWEGFPSDDATRVLISIPDGPAHPAWQMESQY